MHGRRALLVGDFMLDAYLYGETQRVSREAPVLVVRQERVEHRLGGAANTAANLRALGVETILVGVRGEDAAGLRLKRMLEDCGADTTALLADARATPVKTRILAGAFGTSRQQVLRLDSEPEGTLPLALAKQLAESLVAAAPHADVIVVSDYGAGTVTGPVRTALDSLRAQGHRICVDSRYDLQRYSGMAAITPNIPEAEGVVGFMLHDQGAVERAGPMLLDQLQCDAALVTQGQRGMTLFRRGHAAVHTPVVGPAEVTDVTGAGDSVIATLAASLAAGLDLVTGMHLANCAAGVVVTKMGTVTAAPEDIMAAARASGLELGPCLS